MPSILYTMRKHVADKRSLWKWVLQRNIWVWRKNLLSITNHQLCTCIIFVFFCLGLHISFFALLTLPKLNPLTVIKHPSWKGGQKSGMKFQTASEIWQTTYSVIIPKHCLITDNSWACCIFKLLCMMSWFRCLLTHNLKT